MKLTLAFLACLGLAAATSYHDFHGSDEVTGTKEEQKFLFEIVYRVEDPLMFEDWIKYGQKFIVDKSYYTVSSYATHHIP